MLFLVFLQVFPACLRGLSIKINEKIVLERPIMTSSLAAGFGHLLLEGEYSSIAKLLRFNSFDFNAAYFSIIKTSDKPFMLNLYDIYNNGFLTNEDARTLLPSKLVLSQSVMEELSPNEILKLPVHPFAGEQYFLPYHLNENALIASLHRGIKERDPEMNWTDWSSTTPLIYDQVWHQPELWRSFLMEMFCDAQFPVKKKMLLTLKNSIERIQFHSKASIINLLMINVTLAAFYFELCRMMKEFPDLISSHNTYSESIEDLNEDFLLLFKLINDHHLAFNEDHDDLFEGLDLNSSNIVFNSSESLKMNPFYYEERIELFEIILERLKQIPDVFADWFINFLAAFYDVIPKMPPKLLFDTWNLFLSFKPTIKSISTLFLWFENRIIDDYLFQLAKMVPIDLLLLIYKKCPKKSIPSATFLINYNIRKAEYLKTNRFGSFEELVYDLSFFWTQQGPNLMKLLKVFHLIKTGQINLFESIDTFFILENRSKSIGIKKFIEIVMKMFLSIKEWYIETGSGDQNKLEDIPIIVPSPLFPPTFAPLIAKLIIRCRHLNCKAPFKISENYLLLSQQLIAYQEPVKLTKFSQSQLKYLSQSDGSRLPKLTNMYQMYFDIITDFEDSSDSESTNNDDDEEEEINWFFNHHLVLYRAINHLKFEGKTETNWHLTPENISEIEVKLNGVVSKTLDRFGMEIYELINDSNFFNEDEIYLFLYN